MKKIQRTNNVLFGKPRIKGTRMSVEQVLSCLSQGWSFKKIEKEFDLSEQDILSSLEFAHQSVVKGLYISTPRGKTLA